MQISQRSREENSVRSYSPPPLLSHRMRYETVESRPVQAGAKNLFCSLCPQQKHIRPHLMAASIPVLSSVFSSGLLVGLSIFQDRRLHLSGKKMDLRTILQKLGSEQQVLAKFRLNSRIFSDSKSNPTSRPSLFGWVCFGVFPFLVQLRL